MLALSLRQPYTELMRRGMLTVEYRTRPTRIVGERFYLYAVGKLTAMPANALSLDLPIPADGAA